MFLFACFSRRRRLHIRHRRLYGQQRRLYNRRRRLKSPTFTGAFYYLFQFCVIDFFKQEFAFVPMERLIFGICSDNIILEHKPVYRLGIENWSIEYIKFIISYLDGTFFPTMEICFLRSGISG